MGFRHEMVRHLRVLDRAAAAISLRNHKKAIKLWADSTGNTPSTKSGVGDKILIKFVRKQWRVAYFELPLRRQIRPANFLIFHVHGGWKRT
jgi:hypothetical protein